MKRAALENVIETTVQSMLSRQNQDGSFSYCCEVSPLSDAMMVVFLHLVGEGQEPIIDDLCDTILRKQHPDGGWRAYPNQRSDISITTLSYFALLLSNHSKHAPYMMKARAYIQRTGGINKAANLVKIFLATAGQIPWNDLPNPHLEAMLWSEKGPVNLYDFASFARLHIPSFMVLSHLNFSYQLSHRYSLRDLSSSGWIPPQIRIVYKQQEALERAEQFILSRLEPNGTLAGYLSSTALAVFALQALGYSTHHPVIQNAIRGLKEMVYRERGFTHAQLFTSSVWDTALALRATHDTQLPHLSTAKHRAVHYLISRQQDTLSDWSVHTPNTVPGGWGFSDVNTLFPDVDDTVAVLTALSPFKSRYKNSFVKGLRWVLAMQNSDGGWSAFDRNNHKQFLEWIPINDMGRAMTDPSVPDITGRVLEMLGSIGMSQGEHIHRAVNWLQKHQRPDGSWFGRWGITFIYGTWAAVRGLTAVGVPRDSEVTKRALDWLYTVQRDDGGFGESCKSDQVNHYTPLPRATASQTAWALLAMMAAASEKNQHIDRAANYLLEHAEQEGGWREHYPTGAGIANIAYLRYHSYPYVWPLLALSEYHLRYV